MSGALKPGTCNLVGLGQLQGSPQQAGKNCTMHCRGAPMHCMLLRAATLMLVDRQRTTAWQSAPSREVRTPTSALSKNATSRCTIDRNSSALACTGPHHTVSLPRLHEGHSVLGYALAKCCTNDPNSCALACTGPCHSVSLPQLQKGLSVFSRPCIGQMLQLSSAAAAALAAALYLQELARRDSSSLGWC